MRQTSFPAVVTITNSPKATEQAEEEKPTPKGNSEEMPFGFKGTPFEDLFKHHPELFGRTPLGLRLGGRGGRRRVSARV